MLLSHSKFPPFCNWFDWLQFKSIGIYHNAMGWILQSPNREPLVRFYLPKLNGWTNTDNSTFLLMHDHSESGWIFNSNPAADHTNLKYFDTYWNWLLFWPVLEQTISTVFRLLPVINFWITCEKLIYLVSFLHFLSSDRRWIRKISKF